MKQKRVYTRRPWRERLWAKIDRSGGVDACWLWTGGLRNGYGVLERAPRLRGQREYAHRLVCEDMSGAALLPGQIVRHLCEGRYAPGDESYRKCCNPAHLEPGTQKQNSHDCLRTGRHVAPVGEENGKSKLTSAQAAEILRRYAAGGCTHRSLAREYGVGHAAVGCIMRRQTWRQIGHE
jgi:hypothetical protein